MRLNQFTLLLALSMSVLQVKAADQPTLNEKLKPLEWILGRWEGAYQGDNTVQRLVYDFSPDLGGNVVSFRYYVLGQNKAPFNIGIGLYQWRPEANMIAGAGVTPWGHESDLLTKTTETQWIWQSSGYLYGGKRGNTLNSHMKEITKADENTFTVRLYNQVMAGESIPDVTITMKRVTTSAEDEVIQMEKKYSDAIVRRDLGACRLILADDYVGVSGGDTWNKEELMEAVTKGDYVLKSLDYQEVKARVYGDSATLNCRVTAKEQFGGKDGTQDYRATETWVKRDGRWQLVAFHSSKITPK